MKVEVYLICIMDKNVNQSTTTKTHTHTQLTKYPLEKKMCTVPNNITITSEIIAARLFDSFFFLHTLKTKLCATLLMIFNTKLYLIYIIVQ